MNRHERRAEAAKDRATKMRHAAVRDVTAYLAEAAANDPTVTGATLMLPDGQALHISADTARAMAAGGASTTGGRA